jgi:hypothetical protein
MVDTAGNIAQCAAVDVITTSHKHSKPAIERPLRKSGGALIRTYDCVMLAALVELVFAQISPAKCALIMVGIIVAAAAMGIADGLRTGLSIYVERLITTRVGKPSNS